MQQPEQHTERRPARATEQQAMQQLTRTALLAAIALALSYLETMIPLPVPLPGAKLGLANAAIVVALYTYGWRSAFGVAVAKVLAAGFLFGSPVMMAYSLGGTLLSVLALCALHALRVGPVAASVVAAIMHNVGQLLVAVLMLGTPAVLVSLIPLAVIACITGSIVGGVAAAVLPALREAAPVEAAAADPAPAPAPDAAPADADPWTDCLRGEYATPASGFCAYSPDPTPMHGVDARLKIVAVLIYVVASFLCAHPIQLAVLCVLCVGALVAARVTPARAWRQLRPFWWLMAFVLVFNVLFNPSGTTLISAGPITISEGGIAYGVTQIVRFCIVVLGTSVLMITTTPDQITSALASLLRWTRVFGANPDKTAVAVGLTLRFAPLVSDELQARRNVPEKTKSVRAHLANLQPAIVGVFQSVLRKSDAIADAALEAYSQG